MTDGELVTVASESVAVMVARLEGTVNTNFAVLREGLAIQHATTEDHEARIRTVEQTTPTRKELETLEVALAELNRWRWKLIGAFTAISTGVAVAATVITTIIENSLSHP